MNIIQLITNFTNSFNENFGTNITPFNLEEKIKNICKIIKNWYNIHVVNLLSNLLFQLNYKVKF